jgi:hypothetical protein
MGGEDRQLLRLLKLLGSATGGEQETDGDQFRIAGQDRVHQFEIALVRQAVRDGLLAPRGNRLRLTGEGAAHLRRGLHPESGHAAQHSKIEYREVSRRSAPVAVNLNESPLARLRQHRDKEGRPWLGDPEFSAGERLRADFERAGLQPRVSANWEASVASGGRGTGLADLNDFALDARGRVNAAVSALEPSLAGIALDVCCFLKGRQQVERERNWPPRSAKLMLRTALSMLARHYGLSGTGQNRAAIRQWGTSDYRPSMQEG